MTASRRVGVVRPRRSGLSSRRAATFSALAAAGLVLSACAAVPTSGPIEEGPVVDAGNSAQFIRVIAAPPSVGASPSEIVRGFLEANASLDSGHAIARRYLTSEAAESWDPDAATTVYEQSSLELSKLKDSSITAELAINNRLGGNGYLEPVEPAEQEQFVFPLIQVIDSAGIPQWRITDPPAGALISDSDVRRAYRSHQVYQAAQRSGVLVPDGRLLPVIGRPQPWPNGSLPVRRPGWLRVSEAGPRRGPSWRWAPYPSAMGLRRWTCLKPLCWPQMSSARTSRPG